MTWASAASGSIPCGGSNPTGTLTGAQYTQTFGYDNLGRLTSGPLGSYVYGNSAHVHAATAVGSTWTAAYDAAGDMTCRAATGANSCAGNSPNGSPLTWDTEGRLVEWTSPTGAPWSSSIDLYDGEGNRVQQQTVSGGVTTQTYYVSNLEEVSVAGGVTTTTTYYYAGNGGPRIATATNGVFSYLASDTLGTAEVALDANGNTTAAQLYAPYGTTRYSSGTMPGSYGYTGQRADAVTGLDYYGARYYDAVAGVFASADTVLPGKGYDVWGLSRYAYVEGNPITRSDPSGHRECIGDGSRCGDAGSNSIAPQNAALVALQQMLNYDAWADSGYGVLAGLQKADALAAAESFDQKTVFVRASSRAVAYFRRPAGNIAKAAAAREFAETAGKFARGALIVGLLIDAGVAGLKEYNSDQSGSEGLRLERAAIAGVAHAAIVGLVTGAFVVGVAAIPIIGETGIAEVAAGAAGGIVGGMLADQFVTTSNVAAATNVVNTAASAVSSAWSSAGSMLSGLGW